MNFGASEATLKHSNEYMPHKYSDMESVHWIEDDNSLSSSGQHSTQTKQSSMSNNSSRFQETKEGCIPPVKNEVSPSATASDILHSSFKESVSRRMRSRSRSARSKCVAPPPPRPKRSSSRHEEKKSPSPVHSGAETAVLTSVRSHSLSRTVTSTAAAAAPESNERSASRSRGRSVTSSSRLRGYSMSARKSREESKAQLSLLEAAAASSIIQRKTMMKEQQQQQVNNVIEPPPIIEAESGLFEEKRSRSKSLSRPVANNEPSNSERPSRRGRSTSAKMRGRSISATKRERRDPDGSKDAIASRRAASLAPSTGAKGGARSRSKSILRNASRHHLRTVVPMDAMPMDPVHTIPSNLMNDGSFRSVVSERILVNNASTTALHTTFSERSIVSNSTSQQHPQDIGLSHHSNIKPIPILKKTPKHSNSIGSSFHSTSPDKNLRHSAPSMSDFHPAQALKGSRSSHSAQSLNTLNTSETMLCEEDEREEEQMQQELKQQQQQQKENHHHHHHHKHHHGRRHKDQNEQQIQEGELHEQIVDENLQKHEQEQQPQQKQDSNSEEEELLETAELSLMLVQSPQASTDEKKKGKMNPFSRMFKKCSRKAKV